jgi:hypothetical protein
VVLGRIVVLGVSSGCLNTRSRSFYLVASIKKWVVGSCKGELLLLVINIGSYVTGSWCLHPVGVGTLRELVLPSSGC